MDLRQLPTANPSESRPLVPRDLPLNVSYSDPTGTQHTAVLVSRIPDGDGRIAIDRRAAILAGVPWTQLSEYAQARCEALSLVSVQLVDLPDWVNEWVTQDDAFLFALRGEIERHTAGWFLGSDGARQSEEGTARVFIRSSLTPPAGSE